MSQCFVTFNTAELRNQALLALEASERMPTLSQLGNPRYHRGGQMRADSAGFPDTASLNWAAIEPSVWFLKDEFCIYCLANARAEVNDRTPMRPAYARETDPRVADLHACHLAASRLLGTQAYWLVIPAGKLISALRTDRPTVRIEVRSDAPGWFSRTARAVARSAGFGDIAATLVVKR